MARRTPDWSAYGGSPPSNSTQPEARRRRLQRRADKAKAQVNRNASPGRRGWKQLRVPAFVATSAAAALVAATTNLFAQIPHDVVTVYRNLTSSTDQTKPALEIADISDKGNEIDNYAFESKSLFDASFLASFKQAQAVGVTYQWLISHGGASTGISYLQFTLHNHGSTEVDVTNVSVRANCSKPLTGSIILQGGGAQPPTAKMAFDLDTADPAAKVLDGNKITSQSYFNNSTISVLPGVPQTVVLQAVTSKKFCSFFYDLTIDDNGTVTHELVGSLGHPFKVTASEINTTASAPLSAYQSACVLEDGVVPCRVVDPKAFHW